MTKSGPGPTCINSNPYGASVTMETLKLCPELTRFTTNYCLVAIPSVNFGRAIRDVGKHFQWQRRQGHSRIKTLRSLRHSEVKTLKCKSLKGIGRSKARHTMVDPRRIIHDVNGTIDTRRQATKARRTMDSRKRQCSSWVLTNYTLGSYTLIKFGGRVNVCRR